MRLVRSPNFSSMRLRGVLEETAGVASPNATAQESAIPMKGRHPS